MITSIYSEVICHNYLNISALVANCRIVHAKCILKDAPSTVERRIKNLLDGFLHILQRLSKGNMIVAYFRCKFKT